ncbi:hypothetical protein AYI69_g6175 [Smittium culicis]|uniref:Uncharacterized protein n=1 Tax=Smittium culicis TaxID=133412 RepID=A0A1R1Y0W8_9FUNG|nr:hypothetical protein AYI69_g6175 [Smittium culicis]
MASLFEHKYEAGGNVCTIYDEPGGCPKSVDSSIEVVAFPGSIHNSEPEVWSSRRRHVFFEAEQEGSTILQLVPRQESNSSELIDVQMVEMEQFILLFPVEHDRSDDPEGEKRTVRNNISNTVVGISNLVPSSTETASAATHNTSSNRSSSRSCKRKVPDDFQQELVPYGMANQRSTFEVQGISNSAIDIIMKNQRSIRRRSAYYPIQQRFLEWHKQSYSMVAISAVYVFNYLAHVFIRDKLSTSTIMAYKSTICQLTSNPREISESECLKRFLSALDETSIKSFVWPVLTKL